MSCARFASVLKSDTLRKNDRMWFLRWLDAYRNSCGVGPNAPVPVNRELLIAFLRQQKAKAGRRSIGYWRSWAAANC